jgi:hypothetical protein
MLSPIARRCSRANDLRQTRRLGDLAVPYNGVAVCSDFGANLHDLHSDFAFSAAARARRAPQEARYVRVDRLSTGRGKEDRTADGTDGSDKRKKTARNWQPFLSHPRSFGSSAVNHPDFAAGAAQENTKCRACIATFTALFPAMRGKPGRLRLTHFPCRERRLVPKPVRAGGRARISGRTQNGGDALSLVDFWRIELTVRVCPSRPWPKFLRARVAGRSVKYVRGRFSSLLA